VGHTGWLDPKIYGFDQVCRLQVFETWLDSRGLRPGLALDFGCGTGDFSRLLVHKGWDVIGYDKFVVPNYRSPSFRYLNAIDGQKNAKIFDLVISITVLDAIMDDTEFVHILHRLRGAMRTGGHFFFLECSPADRVERSSYQAFRSMPVWVSTLQEAGYCLTETIPFFHPIDAPVRAWSIYERMAITRVVSRVGNKKWLRLGSRRLLNIAARKCLLLESYTPPRSSTINILAGRAV